MSLWIKSAPTHRLGTRVLPSTPEPMRWALCLRRGPRRVTAAQVAAINAAFAGSH